MALRAVFDGPRIGAPILALVGLAFGALCVASLAVWTGMAFSVGPVPVPEALANRSIQILEDPARLGPPQLATATRLTKAELAFGPYRPSAWCRLAYIQHRQSGVMDAAVVTSLWRSYQFGPYDPAVTLWRSQFVLDNWDQAPADLKAAVMREIKAYYGVWDHRQQVELMAARVRNPAGKLAVELVLLRAPLPPH
jgi:hypothetical protein